MAVRKEGAAFAEIRIKGQTNLKIDNAKIKMRMRSALYDIRNRCSLSDVMFCA